MKIICTSEEKERLKTCVYFSNICMHESCINLQENRNCDYCMDKNIEWEIIDKEK